MMTRHRKLALETLGNRIVLSATAMETFDDPPELRSELEVNEWRNAEHSEDVNGDRAVTPMDALLIINDVNEHGARDLTSQLVVAAFLDVNDDGFLSPGDALQVINYLGSNAATSSLQDAALLSIAESLAFDDSSTLVDDLPGQNENAVGDGNSDASGGACGSDGGSDENGHGEGNSDGGSDDNREDESALTDGGADDDSGLPCDVPGISAQDDTPVAIMPLPGEAASLDNNQPHSSSNLTDGKNTEDDGSIEGGADELQQLDGVSDSGSVEDDDHRYGNSDGGSDNISVVQCYWIEYSAKW